VSWRVEVSQRANDDLYEIASFIARDSIVEAGRWLDTLEAAIESLAEMPRRAARAPEFEDMSDLDIRHVVVGPHRVFFEVLADVVVVLHVRDGRRRAPRLDELIGRAGSAASSGSTGDARPVSYALFLDPADFDARWGRFEGWLDHVGRVTRVDERMVRIDSGPQAAIVEWRERRAVDGVWFEVLWFRGVAGEFHGVNEAFLAAVSLAFEARGFMWVSETSYPNSWFEGRGVVTKICNVDGGADGVHGSLFDLTRNPFLEPGTDR
jgi:plasmid stabilization system protein ParE